VVEAEVEAEEEVEEKVGWWELERKLVLPDLLVLQTC
jgi:hypothetical protein